MGDKSGIEWTDATWNPIVGCSIVSPGCTNCYAMRQAARIERMTPGSHYAGTTQPSRAGPVWTGKLALAPEHILSLPLRWRRPRRVFVNSMGDLFHEDVPDAWIDQVFLTMANAPRHTFQVLTKRSGRMHHYLHRFGPSPPDDGFITRYGVHSNDSPPGVPIFNPGRWPLPNVWLGVSAEDQRRADERVPDLLSVPAAVRFVSAEPLLGPITLGRWAIILDWIIAGGESGPGARPMHPDWARSIRDQCAAAGVPFFFKQWGSWQPGHYSESRRTVLFDPSSGPDHGMTLGPPPHPADFVHQWGAAPDVISVHRHKGDAGRLLDGIEHNAMPAARP